MLSCHCCQEVITDGDDQTYHDGQYRLICQLCRPDCLEVKVLNTILGNNEVTISVTAFAEAPTGAYASAYQSFLDQKAAMEDFFVATQNLLWTLPVSHSSYYQAEIKAISLIQEQFDHINTLMQHHRQPQDYPVYTFTPPGRVVNSYRGDKDTLNKVLTKVVVSDRFWDRVINNPLAQNLPWLELSRNSNCDLTIFQRYPELPWDVQGLCLNPNLTLAWIQAYPQLAWDWRELSRNPNFTQDWLEAFPDKPWVAFWLIVNPNFDITWIEIVTYPDLLWSWWDISRHANLTPDWLRRYPQSRWNYREISDKVSTDFFAEHLAKNWDLARIVARPEFSLEFINNLVEQRMSLPANNAELRTLCDMIVSHPQLDLTWLQRFSHLDLYWYGLNCHQNFNWSWCQALPDKPWDWQQAASLLVLD